jgi:hypothetical protein
VVTAFAFVPDTLDLVGQFEQSTFSGREVSLAGILLKQFFDTRVVHKLLPVVKLLDFKTNCIHASSHTADN